MEYKDFVNADLIQDIKHVYSDFIANFSTKDVEMLRDGALHQINEQWPDLLDKLTLAPNGVAAMETLLIDGEDILVKMLLMQILTDFINAQKGSKTKTEQAEKQLVENKGE